MTFRGTPAASLSIWDPIHLGADEMSQSVDVALADGTC